MDKPWWKRRGTLIAAAIVGVALIGALAGGETDQTEPAAQQDEQPEQPDYPRFGDINPETDGYLIALEDSGLVEREGDRRMWGLGVGVCRNLDNGSDVGAEVAGLAEEAALGNDAGTVVAAAALNICPQHEQAVRDWTEEAQ